MTHAEALVVLALEGTIDEGSLRRAYARAVKAHKPEKDPEGFQRVRAAYDRLQELLREEASFDLASDRPAGDLVDAEPPPPANAAPVDDASTDTPGPDPIADEGEGAPLPPASPEEPVERAPPPWVQAYAQAESARGVSGVPAMIAALAIAAHDERAPPPPLDIAMEVMMACLAQGAMPAYAAVAAGVQRWLSLQSSAPTVMLGVVAPIWLLVREIGDAAAVVPPPLTRALGGALWAGGPHNLGAGWLAFAAAHPALSTDAFHLLEVHAPNVASRCPYEPPPFRPSETLKARLSNLGFLAMVLSALSFALGAFTDVHWFPAGTFGYASVVFGGIAALALAIRFA